jgi:CheY-like chemotaxis protein
MLRRRLVHIIDDEVRVRDALALLLSTAQIESRSYASAEEYLASVQWDEPACVVLDNQLPGLSGIGLLKRIAAAASDIAVIMIIYVSADQRERVAKAAITREENRVVAEIKRMRAAGGRVPSNSPDMRSHGRFHPVTLDTERRYREIRRRKLGGELIPDGEWHWFIDYARQFRDPRYELLRGSPGAFGFSLIA